MCAQSPTPIKNWKTSEFMTMDNIQLVQDLLGE